MAPRGGVDGGVEVAGAVRAGADGRLGGRGVPAARDLEGELLRVQAPVRARRRVDGLGTEVAGGLRHRAVFRRARVRHRRTQTAEAARRPGEHAASPGAELARAGMDLPAVSTIHQALRRNGLVLPGKPRRVKADKRFEREASNELWQIDSTELDEGGKRVCVFDCLDDHARYLLCALACRSPSAEAAWACFSQAAAAYGLPRQLLDKTMLASPAACTVSPFSLSEGWPMRRPARAAPAHPQTLGKLERLHRDTQGVARRARGAVDLTELDARHLHAPLQPRASHQGIGDHRRRVALPLWLPSGRGGSGVKTGHERGRAALPAALDPAQGAAQRHHRHRNRAIIVGRRFAGATVRLDERRPDSHLLRRRTDRDRRLDPSRRYQPLKQTNPKETLEAPVSVKQEPGTRCHRCSRKEHQLPSRSPSSLKPSG